ncbi:MAG: 1-acyl-sn-glycerol-3-phosphate acyltransferase [Clostridia bacterium]|nr:1-acyl-sn-glycerol-3-phosphate acyltransferase [Clostridia bacterium]
MIGFTNAFVKITGWLPQLLLFRTKVTYEDKSVQKRHIKGPAIIVSNHNTVYDYAVMLFVFITRTLRYQMAEVLFEKQPLGTLLKCLGGIYLNRNSTDTGFMTESAIILQKGGVVGIFPEGRIPKPGEEKPLEFLPGAAYLALNTGVKVIPVYLNGSYFKLKRARAVIGKPMDPRDFCDPARTEKENITAFAAAMREKVVELEGRA